MRIHIRKHGLITPHLRELLDRRLRIAFGNLVRDVVRVTIHVYEAQTDGVAATIHCHISAYLQPNIRVDVGETDCDLQTVANRAIDRLKRSVLRELSRRDEFTQTNVGKG